MVALFSNIRRVLIKINSIVHMSETQRLILYEQKYQVALLVQHFPNRYISDLFSLKKRARENEKELRGQMCASTRTVPSAQRVTMHCDVSCSEEPLYHSLNPASLTQI